jgi:hypothetical protein
MTDTNISILPIVFRPRIEYAGSMSKMPPPSNYPIKVFIADDSLIVRERLVTPGGECGRSHQRDPKPPAGRRDLRHPYARRQRD